MPHIPSGNSLKYCKLLDKGTPNSQDLAQRLLALNLHSDVLGQQPKMLGRKHHFPPLSSLLPLDRRTIGSLLSMGEEALLVLLSSIHQEKILCWNQNILQNPADFARISLKKVRKTKRSSSVKTFFMFEMQHNCLFLLFQNYFNFNFLSILH